MNKIYIKNFKAFQSVIEIEASQKNILVFGENGSGKSSFFDALKMFFYKDRLLSRVVIEGRPLEQNENDKKDFLRRYNNKNDINNPFIIQLNGKDRTDTEFQDYGCYMFTNKDICFHDIFSISSYLKSLFLPNMDIDAFFAVEDKRNRLIQNVNDAIKNEFKESVTISIVDVNQNIRFDEDNRGLHEEKDLLQTINEAKMHLVQVLIFFEMVKLIETEHPHHHKILVLDDVVNSLDATNRIFLVNYILSSFETYQKVILTHNVGFFNLIIMRIGNAFDNDLMHWKILNLFESDNQSRLCDYEVQKQSGGIKAYYDSHKSDKDNVGNMIRQRFESVMYEYAKLIMVDQFEESGHILTRLIQNNQSIYIKKDGAKILVASDLVDEICCILKKATSDAEKLNDIDASIESYRHDAQLKKIVKVLKSLKMFEKVVMHQMSHGTGRLKTFSDKEINESLVLLKKFEVLVKEFKDKNIYVMGE